MTKETTTTLVLLGILGIGVAKYIENQSNPPEPVDELSDDEVHDMILKGEVPGVEPPKLGPRPLSMMSDEELDRAFITTRRAIVDPDYEHAHVKREL